MRDKPDADVLDVLGSYDNCALTVACRAFWVKRIHRDFEVIERTPWLKQQERFEFL